LKKDAEQARDFAERERGLADTQRTRATAAEAESRKQWERAEGLVYAGQIAQALSAWQEGDAARARALLDATRGDFRGWEYSHLRQRFDETHVTLRGHTGVVWGVAFSPDGKRLASCDDDVLRVFDTATGKELHTLRGAPRSIWGGVAF